MNDVIIFFKNGTTARFQGVENFRDNQYRGLITFRYHGVSTETTRHASFERSNIAGWCPALDLIKEDD